MLLFHSSFSIRSNGHVWAQGAPSFWGGNGWANPDWKDKPESNHITASLPREAAGKDISAGAARLIPAGLGANSCSASLPGGALRGAGQGIGRAGTPAVGKGLGGSAAGGQLNWGGWDRGRLLIPSQLLAEQQGESEEMTP